MTNTNPVKLEIDRKLVARYFFWSRLWFLLLGWGRRFAKQQADRLDYWIEGDMLRVDQGLWWFQRKSIPLARVTDLTLIQGPFARYFFSGIWTLCVHTAGRGTAFPEAMLYGLRESEAARDQLSAAIDGAVKRSAAEHAA